MGPEVCTMNMSICSTSQGTKIDKVNKYKPLCMGQITPTVHSLDLTATNLCHLNKQTSRSAFD